MWPLSPLRGTLQACSTRNLSDTVTHVPAGIGGQRVRVGLTYRWRTDSLLRLLENQLNCYDVVRVVGILNDAVLTDSPHHQRPPRVGDQATILAIYTDPPGFELECSDSNGITIWLGGYSPDDLVLERVWAAPPE